MTKHKKIAISIISVCCALIIGLGVYLGIYLWKKNDIHFTITDTLEDGNGETATIILLGGQSNASGCSSDEYLKKNVSAEKYAEYQNGYDNVYINYISGFNTSNGFVECSTLQGEPNGFFGPELGIAEKLNQAHPDKRFFIIKFAWGGTNLFEQWLSPSSRGKTGTLYRQFVAYVDTSINYLKSKNYKVKIEGMCWMQGESDSFSVENATNYEQHLTNFIKDVRKKFNRYASDDGIAFIDAYIADNPMYWVYCDLVNKSKLAVSKLSNLNAIIDTKELSCSQEPEETPDMAHYDSLSELKLGYLFAQEILNFFD